MKKWLVIVGIVVLLISVGLSGCLEENKPPIADFTTSIIDTGSFDIRGVQFSDNSTDQGGEIVKWYWDFGDGNTSDEQNPIHNFTSAAGYYEEVGSPFFDAPLFRGPLFNVTLTVTDDKNSINSITKTVWAEPYMPLVNFTDKDKFIGTWIPTEAMALSYEFHPDGTCTRATFEYSWDIIDEKLVIIYDENANITKSYNYSFSDNYNILMLIDSDTGSWSSYMKKGSPAWNELENKKIQIQFLKDTTNNTLIVIYLAYNSEEYPQGIFWNDVELLVLKGYDNATLPSGTIEIGDVITNCTGYVILVWTPSETLIGLWDFT